MSVDGYGHSASHGALTGLTNDDHPQYVLRSDYEPLSGYAEPADLNWTGTTNTYTPVLSVPCKADVSYLVTAMSQGWFENNDGTTDVGVRGYVEISVDGGTNWVLGRHSLAVLAARQQGGAWRIPMFNHQRKVLTPTVSEVQLRTGGHNEGTSTSVDLRFIAHSLVLERA